VTVPEPLVAWSLDLDIGEVALGYHLIARSVILYAKDLLFEYAFAPEPRPFQDHCVSPRMVKGLSMERAAHRVASVMSVRPAMWSAPIARLRRAAMALGPDRVLTLDLSSW
jgi:hypothetical protein